MGIQNVAWVLDHSRSTGCARLVLLSIANHQGDAAPSAWPAVETIAREARVNRATVFRSIDKLVELGELEVARSKGGKPNRYRLIGPTVAKSDGCNGDPYGRNDASNRRNDVPKPSKDATRTRKNQQLTSNEPRRRGRRTDHDGSAWADQPTGRVAL